MPGFFGDQAERLVRCRWYSDTDRFAEELYSMFASKKPMISDVPLILKRNSDEAAIKIIDNTDGTDSPIQITRPGGDNTDTPAIGTGGYSCCTKGSGGGAGGGGGKEKPPIQKLPPQSPPGDITYAPPPGGVPYRLFNGQVIVQVSASPDPYGFNGQTVAFSAAECRPYNPPSIPAPTSAAGFGDISKQIASFVSRWNLSGAAIIDDKVSGPGRTCTPGEDLSSDTSNLPQFPD